MADTLTKEMRSAVMSKIRSRGNRSTEIAAAALLRRSRVKGWRRHVALPGRPDFTFRSARVAIFIDGCFWHGCPKHFRAPKSNEAFWTAKIARNKSRDREVGRKLRALGWRVVRIWEHEVDSRGVGKIKAALMASGQVFR